MYAGYLFHLFPDAKFVYMVRDGRDAAYSYMTRSKQNINLDNFKKNLNMWMTMNKKGLAHCNKIGPNNCLIIKYEQLVTQPEKMIRNLIKFLNLKWSNKFLNHHKYVGNEIFVYKGDWSTHQIVLPIYSESINTWIGKIKDFKSIEDIRFIEPMLNKLNYSFEIKNNSYFDQRDELVVKNDKNLKENKDYWLQKSRNISDHIKLFD
jgi:protein-tyrosine sulfotransferase